MPSDPSPPTADEPPRRYTVLLVDDEADILESLQMIIETAADADVVCALGGDEALRALSGRSVDLIITDYKMPGMDGLEFLRRARQVSPGTARMLMTAYPDLELALRAVNEEGVRNVIVKPFEPEMILDNIFGVLLSIRANELQARSFARALHMLRRGSGAP